MGIHFLNIHAVAAFGLVFALSIDLISGRAGVDLSVATTAEQWQCLKTEHALSYAIIRTYRSVGELDRNGPQNIIYAVEAGLEDVAGYMFPCVQEAPYNTANNITCASPEQQVATTVDFLTNNGVGLVREPSGLLLPLHMQAYISRVWLDIEDENPSKYFAEDPEVNNAFISRMVVALEKLAIPVGIYTTLTYWGQIMDNASGYDQYPLWYPRYDGEDSMDFFTPFAGWEEALIKQTGGDISYCGISQVDSDYMV